MAMFLQTLKKSHFDILWKYKWLYVIWYAQLQDWFWLIENGNLALKCRTAGEKYAVGHEGGRKLLTYIQLSSVSVSLHGAILHWHWTLIHGCPQVYAHVCYFSPTLTLITDTWMTKMYFIGSVLCVTKWHLSDCSIPVIQLFITTQTIL